MHLLLYKKPRIGKVSETDPSARVEQPKGTRELLDNRFAARLNSFKVGAEDYWKHKNSKVTTLDLIERAGTVAGLNAVDLNYPDHLEGLTETDLAEHLKARGIALNGYAMRYYSDKDFKLGAFTHPDAAIRRKAIDLTKRGMDSLRAAGGKIMTLWLGQDGFDYPFQADYAQLWEWEIAAIREVAEHDPRIDVSLEYKPNEPRAFALLPDVATTLLAIHDAGSPNLGVTLDFAHVLYADEMPACAVAHVARHSKLLGLHLNDAYGKRDDGLMAGSVHLQQTVELLWALEHISYDGAIYFDTFPDIGGLDPVAECALNIDTVQAMKKVVARLNGASGLDAAIRRQDAVASQKIVQAAIFGL
jgi:xylose isomerase